MMMEKLYLIWKNLILYWLVVSRTSKTPTSIYLANRGYKVANIPIIPNKNLPEQLIQKLKKTLHYWAYL